MYRTKPQSGSFRELRNSATQHLVVVGPRCDLCDPPRAPFLPVNTTSSYVPSKAGFRCQTCSFVLNVLRLYGSWHALPLILNLWRGKRSQEPRRRVPPLMLRVPTQNILLHSHSPLRLALASPAHESLPSPEV